MSTLFPDQALPVAENPELQQKTALTVAEAQQVTVTDAATYQVAGDTLTGLTALTKEIEGFFEPLCKQAFELHKSLTTRRKTYLAPVEQACARLRRAMTDWKTAQDRLQREREREAAEALQRAEQDRLLREAALLEAQGQAALAAAVVEEALAAPSPVVAVAPSTPKVEGVSYMTIYKWRLLDLALVPREFLVLDEQKLTAYAKAMKDAAKVPGVAFYAEHVPVVRGRRAS